MFSLQVIAVRIYVSRMLECAAVGILLWVWYMRFLGDLMQLKEFDRYGGGFQITRKYKMLIY